MMKRIPYEQFKSEVCHAVKREGDLDFIRGAISDRLAEKYFAEGWYLEALYLVAMVDYLSRENGVPPYTGYEAYRHMSLEKERFAEGTIIIDAVNHSTEARERAKRNAIPEFRRHNIMEAEVRDAV